MNRKEREIQWILKEKYSEVQTKDFFKDIKRLENNEPVDYIIGHRSFLDCHIDLSFHPLIPREETEYWVKKAIDQIRLSLQLSDEKKLCILDIFSGSGCIGIALLKHLKNSSLDFSEIDETFIEQIQLNISKNNFSNDRINIFQSDIFQDLPNKKYDYIFANPPYIPENVFESLDCSVRDFEPKQALLARENGLFFIKALLRGAPHYLHENGKMFIEFDTPQKESIKKLLKKNEDVQGVFWKDQFDYSRVLIVSKKKSVREGAFRG